MSKERPEEVVIVDARFLEYGKNPPKGSRFSGAVNEYSIVGYSKYTDADTRDNKQLELGMREDGYLGYTNKNDDGSTFSYLGWVDKDVRKIMEHDILSHFNHDGQLAWELVVSLPSFEYAKEAGLDTLEDYAALSNKVMPKIFKTMGLKPNNVIWWGDHHADTDHPHMHLVWMERRQTRTTGELKTKELNKAKIFFNEEIVVRRKFEEEIQIDLDHYMKLKDDDFHAIINEFKASDFPNNPKIKDLRAILPKTGRLQYNSKNMLPYKKMIDQIITDALNSKEIKPLYDKYIEKLDLLEKNLNQTARSEISTIKETEIKKLYAQIGNTILSSYKQKVKTNYKTKNGQYIREYYSEKHLRSNIKGLLSEAIHEKERELQEWAYENGIVVI